MQAFDTHGVWWLPTAPTKRFSGTLSCSETGELRLTVMGGVLDLPIESDQANIVIHGEVFDDRLDHQVTLSNCFVSKWTQASNPLAVRQEFFAHRGFFGGHLTPDEFRFGSVYLNFSGLSAWAHSLSGYGKHATSFSVSWEHPKHVDGELRNGRFSFGVRCSISGGLREQRLSETVTLSLAFGRPIHETSLEAEVVYPLQNFFTFATDHANALTEYRVSREILPVHQISVVGPRTFSDESEAADIGWWKMLFSLSDIEGRVEHVLRSWFELSDRYSAAFAVYFGDIYKPPGYMDVDFLLTVQALALYHARRNTAEISGPLSEKIKLELDSYLPANQAEGIRRLFDSHPWMLAARAIEALTREHDALFQPLVNSGDHSGVTRFVNAALNTLEFVLTRSSSGGATAVDGAELHWLTERVRFLFKISLLKEMGFTGDQIRTLLERNRLYIHIRDTIQPQSRLARN